ncbi:MAG TPA: hypothetical protein VKT28_10055 [Puia sp.]|nr:hypothetical protein [Puia sp.]
MEFEELQKIWDSQNNQYMYAFNQSALYNLIESKKKKAARITNLSELMHILVNMLAGVIYIVIIATMTKKNMFMYVIAAWMFAIALYVVINRMRRIKENKNFDISINGNLQHAISLTTYQANLSQAMRWNILPVAILVLVMVWDSGKSPLIIAALFICFLVAYLISTKDQNIYKARKRELKILQQKLESEA